MVSISADTFTFVRQNGITSVFRYRRKKRHGWLTRPEDIYFDNYGMRAWRYNVAEGSIQLPRKMVGALLVASIKYNRENPGIRPKWKPRIGIDQG